MSALVQPSEIHRVSIEEYHQLVAGGGLSEDARVELIDGLVVDMSPRSPQHENALRWLITWMFGHLDIARYELMLTGSMTVGASEPEPDVAVLERAPPALAHPSHALLVIEVALTSRDRDLRTKPTVYAPYVAEYWVVDLERGCVVVHRDPAGGAYRDVMTTPRGEVLRPRALELGELATDELFAAAFAERT